ncbi:hypothetical protein WMF27_07975 [Sorangium sp. So ce281]|uniref:hypothetical protein n=1 Tax=Sorangium sp. So ce281 TaxID=3133293 RepID=UPI003F5FA3D1
MAPARSLERSGEHGGPEADENEEVLEEAGEIQRVGRFDRHGRKATSAGSWTSSAFLARRVDLWHARARAMSPCRVKGKVAPERRPRRTIASTSLQDEQRAGGYQGFRPVGVDFVREDPWHP